LKNQGLDEIGIIR